MRKRLAAGVAAFLGLAALVGGVAGAQPPPAFSVTCDAASQTTVAWNRMKIDRVTIDWLDEGGATVGEQVVPVSVHPPHGEIATSPLDPAATPTAVLVTFAFADGSTPAMRSAGCA